jgi:hypothetical protein
LVPDGVNLIGSGGFEFVADRKNLAKEWIARIPGFHPSEEAFGHH